MPPLVTALPQRLFFPWLLLGCMLLAPMSWSQEGTPPTVMVAEVIKRDVSPQNSYVGRVEAVDSVALRARVRGFLEQRQFEEGRMVEQGELLFVIEKAPYETVVAQRQAEVAAARADLKNAQANLARQRELKRRNLTSAADLDTAAAAEAVAEAKLLQAEAALKSAQLDLSYTDIKAPITGRISTATYSVGNLVDTSSEALATITSVDPIYVNIAISERQLMEARRRGINLDNPPVQPALTLGDGSRYEHEGVFTYLAPQVDRSTDTLIVRAQFPNPDGLLVPGQFVTVNIRRKEPIEAIVAPQAAVLRDQQGYYALVVDRANRVAIRRLQVGEQLEGWWVVEQGLATGEQVIVQGMQKVRPEMVVEPIVADATNQPD